MKKDIYLTIAAENVHHLLEMRSLTSNWEYSPQERRQYIDDLGKIECPSCTFRFIKHNNVKIEKVESAKKERFFLDKPDDKDMVEVPGDEIFDRLMNLIPEENRKT